MREGMKMALTAMAIIAVIILVVLVFSAYGGTYAYYWEYPIRNQGVDVDTMWVAVVYDTGSSGAGKRVTLDSTMYTFAADTTSDAFFKDSVALDSSIGYQFKMAVSYDGIDGYSFPQYQWISPIVVSATASVDYDSMNTVLSAEHGSGAWGSGTGNAYTHDVYVLSTTDSTAIPDVRVYCKDTGSAATEWNVLSDNSGLADGSADSGTYDLIGIRGGVNITDKVVDVTANKTDTLWGTLTSGTSTCTVWGYLYQPNGQPLEYAYVTLSLGGTVYDTCADATISYYSGTDITDTVGLWSITVTRSHCIDSARYTLQIEGSSETKEFLVPDTSSYEVEW